MPDGAELLAAWLRRSHCQQNAFARELGVQKSAVNKILLRQRKPSLGLAVLIQERTGIPAHAWVATTEDAVGANQ